MPTEIMTNIRSGVAVVNNEVLNCHPLADSLPGLPPTPPCMNGASFCMLAPLGSSVDLHPSGNGYILKHGQVKFQIQIMPPEVESPEGIMFNCVSSPAFVKSLNHDMTTLSFTSDSVSMCSQPTPQMFTPANTFQPSNNFETVHNYQSAAGLGNYGAVRNYETFIKQDIVVKTEADSTYKATQSSVRPENCQVVGNITSVETFTTLGTFQQSEEATHRSLDNYESFCKEKTETESKEKIENLSTNSNPLPRIGNPGYPRRHGRRRHGTNSSNHIRLPPNDNVDQNNNRRYFNNNNNNNNNKDNNKDKNNPVCVPGPPSSSRPRHNSYRPQAGTYGGPKGGMSTSVQMSPPMVQPFDIFKCPSTGRLFEVYRRSDCGNFFGITQDYQNTNNI